MQTNVELQDPFSYSLLLTAVLIALVLIPIIIMIINKIIHFKPKKRIKKPKPVPPPPKPDKNTVKRIALGRINELNNSYDAGNVTDREAYIKLSQIVRDFVNQIEGNNAINLTLEEIRALKLPQLEALIEQFYQPEFSYDQSNNDIMRAFSDARTVVSKWN